MSWSASLIRHLWQASWFAGAALVAVVCAVVPATAQADPPLADRWVLPIAGSSVVRGFDPPSQPWLAGHRGVDLAAPAGATVHAAGRGVVTYAGMLAGRGVVAVSHGELRTTYEPVTASVTVGEHVDVGEPIGTLATTGGHCLPTACLHWGLLQGETYLDPMELLGGRVRLLPLGSKALTPVGAPLHDRARSQVQSAHGSAARAPDPPRPVPGGIGPVLAAAAARGVA
jgi:murein DD-endopeptidase MepM/ murein hydrolase activator NlpD